MNDIVKIWDPTIINQLIIVVNIDDVCNYACSYCCNPSKGNEKFLDLNALETYVRAVRAKTSKTVRLVLCGGEPTLHPAFKRFCLSIQTVDDVVLQSFTNASQSLDFYEECKNVQWLISYHHCAGTARFEELIHLLAQLDNQSISTVNVMLDPNAFDECLAEYDKLCNEFPDLNVVCNLLNSFSVDGAQDFKKVGYTADQLKQYEVRETQHANQTLHAIDSNGSEHIIASQREAFGTIAFNYRHWKCSAGESFLHIDVIGDVRKCSAQNHPMYNIYTVTSDQIKLQPCICQSTWCPTGYDLMKQRLFLNK